MINKLIIDDLFYHQNSTICSKIVGINLKKININKSKSTRPLIKMDSKTSGNFWITFLSGIACIGAYFIKKITNNL